MEITVKLPQLDTLDARLEDIETCLKTLLESNRKFNATPTVVQPSVLMTATPEPEKPERVRRGSRRKAELSTTSVATSVISGSGKDDADQEAADVEAEDTLRARTQFESKRVARTFGIGASRAVIKKVAGANVVNIDDVPAWQLLTLLGELQAM